MSPDNPMQRLIRCQRALDTSQDGFWERCLRTQTVWYSPAFLALFGFAEGDLPNARGATTARVHPDDQQRFRAAYREAVQRIGPFDYEVRFLDAAGQWRWVRGRGRVWADEAGRPEFICGSLADVHHRTTKLHKLEDHRRELESLVRERTAGLEAALALVEQRRREAERANAAKSRFLAQMSHEIRTPLNGVMGLTELALRAATSPEQRRHLDAAGQSGRALLQVINDVLDFSRLESGHAERRERLFEPATMLADTLRAVMPLASRRDLALMYDWVGDSPQVLADESALRQIVTNLLGNAIKFTRQGQVSLLGTAQLADDGRLAVTVAVADTGPGVPEALRERVFEAFEQGDDSLARHHGGTGLGLTIARRLAQAMGGSLRLDSPAEGGSVFTLALHLPVAPGGPGTAVAKAGALPDALPGTPPGNLPAAPLPAAGRRAWVVYHQLPPGQWLAGRLQRLGWQVDIVLGLPAAVTKAQALAQAQAATGPGAPPPPDLVLLAGPALLPGFDLAPLRQALPLARMHLLIRPDWHDSVLEPQAAALRITPLVAPITPATLLTLAKPEPASSGAPEADRQPAEPPATPTGLCAGAEVLLVEDNPVNQLVGQAYLKALGLRVRLAANGHEALAACAERAPALVLMDLQMPGMDGLEATTRLLAMQRAGQWPGAPIVALTAHASEADRAACFAAGMRAVLTKPLSLDMLRQQLVRWLPA